MRMSSAAKPDSRIPYAAVAPTIPVPTIAIRGGRLGLGVLSRSPRKRGWSVRSWLCMDQSSIGCDTQMSLSEGDSIGRWYRRYFGINRRDECRSHRFHQRPGAAHESLRAAPRKACQQPRLTHDGGNRLQKYEWPDGTAECPRACSY